MAVLHSLYPSSPNVKIIKEVAQALIAGALVIYPTDTVYALGCLSSNYKALGRLAKLKEVKVEQAPFSFLFADMSELSNYVQQFDSSTFRILKRTLPGPFTYIMKGTRKLPKPFDKRKSIGIRISDDPILKILLPLLPAPYIKSNVLFIKGVFFYKKSTAPFPIRTTTGSPSVKSMTVEGWFPPAPVSIMTSTAEDHSSNITSGSVV